MRLFIGFLFVLAILLYIQRGHPECSMSNMIGVEWLECLTHGGAANRQLTLGIYAGITECEAVGKLTGWRSRKAASHYAASFASRWD
jgi:hypothetical protein